MHLYILELVRTLSAVCRACTTVDVRYSNDLWCPVTSRALDCAIYYIVTDQRQNSVLCVSRTYPAAAAPRSNSLVRLGSEYIA